MAFLGIPGSDETSARHTMYQQQLGAQRSQYARQRQLATGRIGSSVASAMGTQGNTAIGGRLAAHEAGRVQGDLANAEAVAADQLRAQQMAHEQEVHAQEMATQRQVFGGLIGGAGQVLGMAVPAFGAANGAIGGAMGSSPQQGGGVGALGQALIGGGGTPMASTAPITGPTMPNSAQLGGAGPIGPQGTPQFVSPDGRVETFEERMRRLQLGGGFVGSPQLATVPR